MAKLASKKEIKKGNVEDLSEADKELKEQIVYKVERLCNDSESDPLKHLKDLFQLVLTSKKSRTSIPKELKFLAPLFKELVERFNVYKERKQNQ